MSDPHIHRLRSILTYALVAVPVVALGVAAFLVSASGSAHGRNRHAQAHATSYVREAPDPLASQSYAQSASSVHHADASAPRIAALHEGFLSPGAPSDQQVQRELAQEQAIAQSESKVVPRVSVDPLNGKALAPADLPIQIQEVIAGGNAIRDFPYVYGGGHRSFIDDAYDCSGSVSYALAAAGLINAPETSGQLESWGAPGPGRYLTVFATDGHTFMYVDGVWFDTAGRAGPYTTRWLTAQPPLDGYVERHYPGL
jgi:cell wall-associated NlpC family hydrolase